MIKKMTNAPKDKLILLYFSAFGCYSDRWWVGMWSFQEDRWCISTPFTVDGKALSCTKDINPLGWQELPNYN